MGLQIITGKSGSGKTTYMFSDFIKKSQKNIRPDKKFICIVPEQFSLETQKNIISLSKGSMASDIDILSFERLSERIFEEQGINNYSVLDDMGKMLILRKIIDENKKSLSVFESKSELDGFVMEVKSVISEFYQYGVNKEKLESAISSLNNKALLSGKLKDISLIMEKFDEYIKNRYIVTEEILGKVCSLIPNSKMIRGCEIIFDEYTGFTPVQYEVIKALLKYSDEVSVSITLRDPKDIDFKNTDTGTNVFGIGIKTINMLKTIASDLDVKIYDDIILENNIRFKNNELMYLEDSLFKIKKDSYANEVNNISIHRCLDEKNEIEYLAYTIKELVRKNGYRYKDIAVVTSDVSGYKQTIEEVFKEYDISYFIDYKESMSNNGISSMLEAMLLIIEENFSYESVFRYLKSGYSNISDDDVDIFENYVIKKGVRGKKRYYNSFVLNEKDEEEKLNEIRLKFIDEIDDVYNVVKKGKKFKLEEAIVVIKVFLEKINIKEKINEQIEIFKKRGEISRTIEYSQVLDKLDNLFDKMIDINLDEKIKISELINFLSAGFCELKVGIPPIVMDRVVVGDIERTRLNNIKVMFLIGANDDLIPRKNEPSKILSDSEREYVKKAGVALSPSKREDAFIQKYYLYLILTKASEKLFISYRSINNDGTQKSPSYIVKKILDMFENMHIYDESEKMHISNIDTALNYFAANLYNIIKNSESVHDKDYKEFMDLYAILMENEVDVEDIFRAVSYIDDNDFIEKEVAKALYGDMLSNSVSRIETYAKCAYKQFLSYGLNLYPRKEFVIDYPYIGNIYHSIMEKFLSDVKNKKFDLTALSDEERDEKIVSYIDDSVSDKEEFSDSKRNEYIKKILEKVSKKSAWAISNQLANGKLKPMWLEYKFSSANDIMDLNFDANDIKVNFTGKIDRIDYYENGDDVYVRVIDYKTGDKKFSISDVYNGIELQLTVYLEAALNIVSRKFKDKNIIPAGMFYFNINDKKIKNSDMKNFPALNEDGSISENLKNITLKNYKLLGLSNSDKNVACLMDNNLKESDNSESNIFNIKYKKDGELDSDHAEICRSSDDILRLIKYINEKIKGYVDDLTLGDIKKNPVKKESNGCECDYCEYRKMCRITEDKLREFEKIGKKEIWDRI